MRNQHESVLKMFLKLVSEILQTIYYWRFNSHIMLFCNRFYIVCNGPEHQSTLM